MPADAFIKNAKGDGFPFPLFFAIDKSRQNIYYRKLFFAADLVVDRDNYAGCYKGREYVDVP